MKILTWNYRGLGEPSTISQLKESIKLYLPDITFVCETKQKKRFVNIVCKSLKVIKEEVVDPIGRKGGLLLFWGEEVIVSQIIKFDFCVEMKIE